MYVCVRVRASVCVCVCVCVCRCMSSLLVNSIIDDTCEALYSFIFFIKAGNISIELKYDSRYQKKFKKHYH